MFYYRTNDSLVYSHIYSYHSWAALLTQFAPYGLDALTQTPCKYVNNIMYVPFIGILITWILSYSFKDVLKWLPDKFIEDKATLLRVMTWCRRTESYYLDQCWFNSLTLHGISRGQGVGERFKKNHFMLQYVKKLERTHYDTIHFNVLTLTFISDTKWCLEKCFKHLLYNESYVSGTENHGWS